MKNLDAKQPLFEGIAGLLSIMFIALRAYNPHSKSGQFLICFLFVAACCSFAIALLLACRNKSIPASPEETAACNSSVFSFIFDFLRLVGRHALFLMLIHLVDGWFHPLYQEYGRKFRILSRVLIDLSVTEFLFIAIGRFVKARRSHYLAAFLFPDEVFVREESKFVHLIYYCSFAYVFLYYFLRTTMFRYELSNSGYVTRFSRVALNLLILVAVFAMAEAKNHYIWLLQVVILSLGIVHYNVGGGKRVILAMFILIAASCYKQYRTILWIYLIEGLSLTIIVFLCTQFGLIENLAYYNGVDKNLPRYALGSISPTDFAAHLVYLTIAWCILCPPVYKLRFVVSCLIMGFFICLTFFVNRARGNSVLLMLVLALTILAFLASKLHFGISGFSKKLKTVLLCVFSFSFLFFLFFSLHLCITYRGKEPLYVEKLFSSFIDMWSYRVRIYYGHEALKNFPLTLLGSTYIEVGNGGLGHTAANYTFLDISYIRVIVIGGVLIAAMMIGIMVALQVKEARKGHLYIVMLLSVIALNCAFEHHLYELSYNIFPALILTSCSPVSSVIKKT